ncbi:MAG TPA: hypothetical protein VFS00_22190, partial [Polyangiaceae bacterium]|nr:hypothetical protein [Polyangiaceae bacterium]
MRTRFAASLVLLSVSFGVACGGDGDDNTPKGGAAQGGAGGSSGNAGAGGTGGGGQAGGTSGAGGSS